MLRRDEEPLATLEGGMEALSLLPHLACLPDQARGRAGVRRGECLKFILLF